MAIEQRFVDKRIVERSLAQAKLDPAEYRQYLASLPDRSDRVSSRDEHAEATADADARPE